MSSGTWSTETIHFVCIDGSPAWVRLDAVTAVYADPKTGKTHVLVAGHEVTVDALVDDVIRTLFSDTGDRNE